MLRDLVFFGSDYRATKSRSESIDWHMAKRKDGLDLMVALGAPESEDGPESEQSEKSGKESGYLDSKDPELVSHLMDAVDDSLSPEERAEALCRAIEASGAAKAMPVAEDTMMSEVGAYE